MGWVYVYLHTLSSVSGLNAMVYKNVHMLLRLLRESSLFNGTPNRKLPLAERNSITYRVLVIISVTGVSRANVDPPLLMNPFPRGRENNRYGSQLHSRQAADSDKEKRAI